MDYKQTKIGKFFLGKGFYGVLALCLVAVGAAAWSAFNRVSEPNTLKTPSSSSQKITSSEVIPPKSEVQAETPSKIPYSSEESSSDQTPAAPIVATAFASPMGGGVIKPYSDTELIYSATFSDMRTHLGIDIEGEQGSDVRACGNGIVSAITDDSLLGKCIEIDHGNGVKAKYCGLDTIFVSLGETVSATTTIGLLGEVPEECEDVSHLHLEFYFEEHPVDPLRYIG